MNAGLMERLSKLQDEMQNAHEQLAQERLTITAGGAAVKIVIDGAQRIHEIQIAPEVLADREMLQDLLVVAFNNAMEQSQTLASQRLQGLNNLLGLPGM